MDMDILLPEQGMQGLIRYPKPYLNSLEKVFMKVITKRKNKSYTFKKIKTIQLIPQRRTWTRSRSSVQYPKKKKRFSSRHFSIWNVEQIAPPPTRQPQMTSRSLAREGGRAISLMENASMAFDLAFVVDVRPFYCSHPVWVIYCRRRHCNHWSPS